MDSDHWGRTTDDGSPVTSETRLVTKYFRWSSRIEIVHGISYNQYIADTTSYERHAIVHRIIAVDYDL